MLSDAAVKLQEGKARLAGAGDDERLLGMALMSLHGALEEHLREQLAREIATETQARPDWPTLVELWQKHRLLSPENRALILKTNSKRNQIAHGEPFHLSRTEVERYAQFVQDFMGVRARPSRRWSKVEEAVVWDDPGVRPAESPLETTFWSSIRSSLRLPVRVSTQSWLSTSPSETLADSARNVDWRQMKVGWVVKMVLVAALALLSFLFWNSWLVSVGFTAVLLYLIHRQGWLRAAYVYVAGLVYGFATTGLGLAMAVALASALLWPLAVGFWYVTDGTLELPQAEPLVVPTIERLDEVDEEQFVTAVPVEAPVVQTPEPELPTGPLQIRVQGNSRVRAEPNTTSAILAVVTDGEVYVVLAANEDNTWYKIQLASGAEGWIGSSRVIEITP